MVRVNGYRNFLEEIGFSQSAKFIWGLGLILFLSVAVLNPGVIAMDDYFCIISQIIPAQNLNFKNTVAQLGFRNPLAVTGLLSLTKLFYELGVQDPIQQIRLVLLIVGGFNFFVFSYFGAQFFKGSHIKWGRELALGIVSFYFMNPLIYTRPMIETLSAPFLFLACFNSFRYWETRNRFCLVRALVFLTISSMLRFQTGVCIGAILILLLLKKDIKGGMLVLVSTLLLFVLSGLFESVLTGRFHGSLKDYVSYNLNHSSSYGTTPFYTFFLLLFALTLPPTLVAHYQKFEWKKKYFKLIPVLLFVGVFVLAHSVVPHKEERFMIPILPLFLIGLVPLISFVFFEQAHPWRRVWFLSANTILLLLTSFNTPQSNTINLVRYLGGKAQIKKVWSIKETLVLYPTAYILNPPTTQVVEPNQLESMASLDCDSVLVVREDYERDLAQLFKPYRRVERFNPGPLEQALVKLNPRQNLRRGSISLYASPSCSF